MATNLDLVQQLYVAYFNRPGDNQGVNFYTTVLDSHATTIEAIAADFAKSAEYKAQFAGKQPEEVIDVVYMNMFGRHAEKAALDFYGPLILNGTITIDKVVTDIVSGAQGTDAVAYDSKVAAAVGFTEYLNAQGHEAARIAYLSGKGNVLQQARDYLSGVTTVAGANAAIAAMDTTANALIGSANGGTTQALTTGVDTITGTDGNDVIKGLVDAAPTPAATTLTALDSINGGKGVDTLEITALTAITAAPSISVTSVENVTIRAASTVTADISNWSGVEQLTITEAGGAVALTAAATTNITSTQKVSGGNATTTINGGKDVVVTQTSVDNTADDIAVGGTKAAAGTVNVTSTGIAAVHGTNVTLGDIAVTGGTKITVTQVASESAAGLTVGAAATHTQGSVTITGNASTTEVTSKQTANVTAKAGIATVAAVTETASVKFSAMTAGQTLVAGGLTFTAGKNLTAAEVAATFAKIIKGPTGELAVGDTQGAGLSTNGTYTGNFTGWTSAAAAADTVVFTSTAAGNVTDLAFTGTATAPVVTTTSGVAKAGQAAVLGSVVGAVNVADAAGSIKTITVDGYATASGVTGGAVLETLNLSNSATGATFTVADTAATLALNLEKVGSSTTDAVVTLTAAPTTLNVKSTGSNYVNLTAAATETLNVSGTGLFDANASTLAGLKAVKVTGTAGLNLGGVASTTLTSVDTTGTTGTTTVSVDGTKATVTGGAGSDKVTVTTTAVQKAITLGAGNDTVTLASGTTAIATEGSISGGEGTADKLVMVAADAVTASAGTAFAGKVTGFERLVATTATGAQEIETDVLGNYNDVEIASAAGGSALTLDGMTSGATVRLSDNTNVSTIVKIKNAATSTTDVGNVVITETGAGSANGIVTFADVETVNITTVEGDDGTAQALTLVATSATKLTVAGDVDLTLNNSGNVKVAVIDASTMTGALTVQAAGNTATTITGGSGDDVLTASASGSGSVQQVSTLTFTNGAGAAAMAAGDTITVTVSGNAPVVVPFNTSFAQTMTDVTTAVSALAGVSATLVGGNVVTITADVAGVAFTANSSFTSAYVAGGSVTGTYAEGAVNQVFDVDTITFTDNAGAVGAMAAGDTIAFTVTDAAGVVTNVSQVFTTDFATTLAAAAAQVTAAGYTAAVTGGNAITVTGAAGKGALVIGGFLFADAGAAGDVTAVIAEGATNFVADADTLVVAESPAMAAGDTIVVNVTNGVGTTSSVAVVFNTDLDTTMAAVATAVGNLAGLDAAYTAGTNTLTVTDAVTGGSPITNITLTFVDKVTSVTSSFTTTTSNLAVTAAADVLVGGAGNDTLVSQQGLATLTGGAGNDLFKVGAASLNVNSYATVTDFTADDLIQFAGATSFVGAKLVLGDTAVFQDYANAAINSVGANAVAWFQFGNATYVVMDAGVDTTSFTNGSDMIVKLAGNIDLTNASFNATQGTIGLI